MIWLKKKKSTTKGKLAFSSSSDLHFLEVSCRRVCVFSSNYHPELSRKCDQTSGHPGLQLIPLCLLEENSMRIQCTCVSLRASIALFLLSPADLCNSGVLTFSHSSVYVSTVPAGPGIGTGRCQERGPRLPNYFSSCYKCPQMQHIILRHLCGHDILLAPSILLLPRKIILISKPFSSSS